MNDKPKPYPIKDIHHATKTAITKAFGYKSDSTLNKWDCPRNADKSYSLPEVINWRIAEQIDKALPLDGDAMLGGGNTRGSVGLEDYRVEAAKLKGLDVKERMGELIRVETMQPILTGLASLLRGIGEKLQRQHGEDARLILDEALDAFERQLRKQMKGAKK